MLGGPGGISIALLALAGMASPGIPKLGKKKK